MGTKTRIGLYLCLVLILCVIAAGCSSNGDGHEADEQQQEDRQDDVQSDVPDDADETGDELMTGIVAVTDDNVRFLGRTYQEGDATYFNWTGAGFEFNFEGTAVEAEFVTNKPDDDERRVLLYVFVDGKDEPEDGKLIQLDADRKSYELASNLAPGTHTIKVLKRSANIHGGNFMTDNIAPTNGVVSLNVFDGKLLPPPPAKERKLEFIGDSITVGAEVVFGEREDGWQTYAAYAARTLDADMNVQAISGMGLISSILGGPLFDLPKEFPWVDKFHKSGLAWDFSKYQSDVVVINLGTNDNAGVGEGKKFTVQEFEDAYVDFVMEIKSKYPNCKVIGSLGAMSDTLFPQVEAAIKRANEQAGETFAYSLKYDRYVKEPGAGGHPTAKKQAEHGEALVELIREITGWQ